MANSYVYFPDAGETTDYSIPFDYLSQDFVKAIAGGASAPFTFLSTNMIRFDEIPEGPLWIYRDTPTGDLINTYINGSVLLDSQLNTSYWQTLHISEETAERAVRLDIVSNTWDGQNRRVKNVADPVNPNDAANRAYMDQRILEIQDAREVIEAAIRQGEVPIYPTKRSLGSITIPAQITAIRIDGDEKVGDGGGGFYTIYSNDGTDWVDSGGPTARSWFRATDTTKADVGLSSVDNTPDLLKPISIDVQTALDALESMTNSGALGAGTLTEATALTVSKALGPADAGVLFRVMDPNPLLSGFYVWDGTVLVRKGDLYPPEIATLLGLITNGEGSILTVLDARNRRAVEFSEDGGMATGFFSIQPSTNPGFRIVDARQRYIEIEPQVADDAVVAAPILKPYVAPALYGDANTEMVVALNSCLTNRDDAIRVSGTLTPKVGPSVDFMQSIAFDPTKVGPSIRISTRGLNGATVGESADIPLRLAPAGSSSPVIYSLTDSIGYRAGLYWQDVYLRSRGYTPDYQGTLRSYGATEGSTSGGKLGEVKPGHQFGDFTFQRNTVVQALPSGDEALYDAMPLDEKRLRNTLLRDPSGDPAGDIVNGKVMDFNFYRTRHGLALPTPGNAGVLNLSLWTNDINALTADQVNPWLYSGLSLTLRRWRVFHPTWPVVITLPGTARHPEREEKWPRYISAIKAVWKAVKDFNDPNVHLVCGWAQVSSSSGYRLTASDDVVDPITGAIERRIVDGVHPTDEDRNNLWFISGAAVAYAINNIVT